MSLGQQKQSESKGVRRTDGHRLDQVINDDLDTLVFPREDGA